jgi:ABC-type Fe3+/spermidine/putrescine transport system ATPase subunit
MRNGVIEQLGAPREIYENPATEFIATFLGASNLIEATVTGTGHGARRSSWLNAGTWSSTGSILSARN